MHPHLRMILDAKKTTQTHREEVQERLSMYSGESPREVFAIAADAYHAGASQLMLTARSMAENNPMLALLLTFQATQYCMASATLLAAQHIITVTEAKP